MTYLIRAFAIYLTVTSLFGCAVSGEVSRLQRKLDAAEERLRSCKESNKRAATLLMDVERLMSHKAAEQPNAAFCNNCVNPPDTLQCANHCVLNTRRLWDPERPHPSEVECARIQGEPMTLANAQDIRTCERDAYTRGVTEMQERRRQRHRCNDCAPPPNTTECVILCNDGPW